MCKERSAWNDYFSGTSQPQVINQQITRQTPSNESVHILNCLFQSITATSNGGAVYCSTSVIYLLVESSSFFSCKTSAYYGGAICFLNMNNGQSVLHTVCGNDCNSGTAHGQHIGIFVGNTALIKNYVNYSSFSRCLNEQRTEALAIYFGKVCCPSLNVSMNRCNTYSAIYYRNYIDSSSVTCSLSYSSIVNNSAASYNCIYFSDSGVKSEIKSCNILRNTQVNLGSGGTIQASGNLMIQDSCILDNKATNIFYTSSSSYTITLSNCTVDSTSNNGFLTTRNTVTKSFILGLNHMSTRNCHSEYDSAGTLTAAPYIPTYSSSKGISRCICKTFHYQAKISDLFSLTYIFMIAFIHIDASKYSLCDINRFYE
jgi:hypothetical protein